MISRGGPPWPRQILKSRDNFYLKNELSPQNMHDIACTAVDNNRYAVPVCTSGNSLYTTLFLFRVWHGVVLPPELALHLEETCHKCTPVDKPVSTSRGVGWTTGRGLDRRHLPLFSCSQSSRACDGPRRGEKDICNNFGRHGVIEGLHDHGVPTVF